MKILVLDQDSSTVKDIASAIGEDKFEIHSGQVKNEQVKGLDLAEFDMIFFDPGPLDNAKPVVLSIRRGVRYYPYIVLMAEGGDSSMAVEAGANDFLSKPLNAQDVLKRAENAENLLKLIQRIGDDSEDFPSAGGVIAKSAFNQLFASGVERADRYGEKSYILFISLKNYFAIYETEGAYAADYVVAKLSQYLVRLRRQSDIIGQTARNEYALLLQRPSYPEEPIEAITRFAETLNGYEDLFTASASPAEISLKLVDLPSGAIVKEELLSVG